LGRRCGLGKLHRQFLQRLSQHDERLHAVFRESARSVCDEHYCYFNVNPRIQADRAFEVPTTPGVQFHDLLTVPLGAGMIDNVINNTGGPAEGTNAVPVDVVSFP
jgi:hypothetical protein